MRNQLVLLIMAAAFLIFSCASIEGDWVRTTGENSADAYRAFLKKHPDSQYSAKAQGRIITLSREAWEKTWEKDKVYEYERFLQMFPDSDVSHKARVRMEWQKANRAIVEISYPEEVQAGPSPYSNITWTVYTWDTEFRETSGKAGFKLRTTKFYIQDPTGRRWTNPWCRKIEVKPNGRAVIEYWCEKSSKWAGGYYYTTWVGEDDLGNKISIEQKVHLVK